MNNYFKPSVSGVWDELAAHRRSLEDINLVDQFKSQPDRFDIMHAGGAGIILDYSKNLVTNETLDLFLKAAEHVNLKDKINSLFDGNIVNVSENRQALHTALRDFTGTAPYNTEVESVILKMTELVEQIHSGEWKGTSGCDITDVVNIGIGGSHLGPMLVTEALNEYRTGKVRSHFISNIDKSDINSVLEPLDPDKTIFIVCSKTFSTPETLRNATTAKDWLIKKIPEAKVDCSNHFLAVTANPDRAHDFGIPMGNILPMWDWVGGRYSLWSAIGLSIALSIGMNNFNLLRKGAAEMDEHFRTAPFQQNLPVLLAILDIWYINYWDAQSHAVLPYIHHLRYLPEFLQQLEMESNGKSISVNNKELEYQTASVLWGTVETNGQHSFHQLLHQGTRFVPVDFILELNPETENDVHHPYLVANCLAQSNALMFGKNHEDSKRELIESGIGKDQAHDMALHRKMPGNRPSNTLIMEHLTPQLLGSLLAMYEHKVFTQSVIWNINAFDQWGVELGKVISTMVHKKLVGDEISANFDSSTEGLITLYKKAKANSS